VCSALGDRAYRITKFTIMKRKITLNKGYFWSLLIGLFLATGFAGCQKKEYPLVPLNNTLNITSYIEANLSQFSLWDQVLQRTGYDGFLGAYGSYTVFVPSNSAVTLYLKSKGASAVGDINVDTLKDLVRYHVILNDTISTLYFIDGKLRSPTFLGQYLTSSVANVGGESSYQINKQALITQSNIYLGNGVMHVIDHVLHPATLTLAQTIAANPKYSIFTQALKATGFYDTINVAANANPNKARNYFTVFAQSDSDYAANGIANYTALAAKYATTSTPLHNPADGLYGYVSYHIMAENSYISDILSKPSHASLSPGLDVITDVLQGQNVQLDYDLVLGVQYPGVRIDRPNSDIPTTNGVLHAVLGDLYIKLFPPTRVDWDLADQPEFRKLTSVFRRPGQSSTALTSPLSNISFDGTGTVTYVCQSTTSGTYYWWNEILNFNNWRVASGIPAITFVTPTIIKGKYKVWFGISRGSGKAGVQFYFDGVPLQNVIPNLNTSNYQTPADSGPVMEAKGWKRYTTAPYTLTTNAAYNTVIEFYCGTVNVTTTDHHLFKLVAITNSDANPLTVNIVQFIPFDQDQETPRYFGTDGSIK